MKIAIITAMAEETLPIYAKFGQIKASYTISGVMVREIETERHTLYLATSGIGEIRAALAVQMLADKFKLDVVLNFGFVGALNAELQVGELVIAEQVCHYQFDISTINKTKLGQYDGTSEVYFTLNKTLLDAVNCKLATPLRLVKVASGDKFVAKHKDKEFLRNYFDADICEMELAGITIAAERNNLPVFSMKVVADKADESAAESFEDVLAKGLTQYEEVLPAVLDAINTDNQK